MAVPCTACTVRWLQRWRLPPYLSGRPHAICSIPSPRQPQEVAVHSQHLPCWPCLSPLVEPCQDAAVWHNVSSTGASQSRWQRHKAVAASSQETLPPSWLPGKGELVDGDIGIPLLVLCRSANRCSCAIHSLYPNKRKKSPNST